MILLAILDWHVRCLESCVQNIGHSSRSIPPFAAKMMFCLVALVLALASASANSQAVMTLAMAHPVSPAEKNFSLFHRNSSAQLVGPITVQVRQKDVAEKSQPAVQNSFSSEARLEQQTGPSANRPFLLVHQNLGPNRSMNVRAGYKEFWDNTSVLRKISPDEQEPGIAYVQASFRF